MPHIDIKCYPKHLSEDEFQKFIDQLTLLAESSLHAGPGDISINYTEIQPEQWKEKVWDKEIEPNLDHLAKRPGYEM